MASTDQNDAAAARGLGRVLLAGGVIALSACVSGTAVSAAGGVRYEHLVRADPRPLHIHVVEADLSAKGLAFTVRVADDPDGDGPAEAALTSPLQLAHGSNWIVAVNANPFRAILTGTNTTHRGWTNRMPVDISGWAVVDGRQRSASDNAHAVFSIDTNGRAHSGSSTPFARASAAVAGFGVILRDGEVPPLSGTRATALHPRTAAGVDRTGRRIWLVVVDGRRQGYSEGVTEVELGHLMKELGAWEAVNLDGGGSSILLYNPDGAGPRIMNRPSDGHPRPVPVVFGLVRRPVAR